MGPRWLKITGLLLFLILLVINTYLLLRGESRLTRLESDLNNHSNKLARMEAPVSGELSENLEFLNTRVHLLTSFISDLEVKLTSLKGQTEAINRDEPQHKTEDPAPARCCPATGCLRLGAAGAARSDLRRARIDTIERNDRDGRGPRRGQVRAAGTSRQLRLMDLHQ